MKYKQQNHQVIPRPALNPAVPSRDRCSRIFSLDLLHPRPRHQAPSRPRCPPCRVKRHLFTMSAVRRNDRRANRSNLSSPYARPSKSSKAHPSKKSVRECVRRNAFTLNQFLQLWTLSGLINFLNPFGGDSEPDDSDMSGPSDGEIEQGPPPRRFSPPPLQPLPPLPPPPQQQACTRPTFLRVQDRSILI